MTFAGFVRFVGGGTFGGLVRTAWTGSPTGGPKSPLAEPPVIAADSAATGVPFDDVQPLAPSVSTASRARSARFMQCPLFRRSAARLGDQRAAHPDLDQGRR